MCGIGGIWQFAQEVSTDDIAALTRSLNHRGPDSSAHWVAEDRKLTLVHTRLSILDLSELGAQPMTSVDGRLTMVFNGEIFNFIELKRQLIAEGHAFQSESDTEVVLTAFQHWGTACFSKFNGMWAMAIYDHGAHQLILSRDRFGIKPLYVYQKGSVFGFASETNAFKELSCCQRSINQHHLNMALDNPSSLEGEQKTIFDNVTSVAPGHWAVVGPSIGFRQSRYYDAIEAFTKAKNRVAPADQVEAFESLLIDSTKLRLRSDVPIATALSGGLDSSSVFAIVNELNQQSELERVPSEFNQAFVSTSPGSPMDESVYAKSVVEFLQAKATFIDASSSNQLADKVISSTVHNDCVSNNPIDAISGVYKSMRDAGIVISLDGHGVDEMMFGYRNMVSAGFYQSIKSGQRSMASRFQSALIDMYPKAQRQAVQAKTSKEFNNLNPMKSMVKRIIGVGSEPSSDNAFVNAMKGHGVDPIEAICYQSFLKRDLPFILRNFDKAAMRSSVEIRMPFMDYRLVEMVFGLPIELKIDEGKTKHILRRAMRHRLPDDVVNRTWKVGFQSPLIQWLDGPLKEPMAQLCHTKKFVESSNFDGRKALETFQAGSKNGWTQPAANEFWKTFSAYACIDGVD